MPDDVAPVARRADPNALGADLLKRLKELTDLLCPAKAPAPAPKRLTVPHVTIGGWFPTPLQAGQYCYAWGDSDCPDQPHRSSFLDSPGGSVIAGYFSVSFPYGNNWVSYMTAPADAGDYYLCIEVYDGSTWVSAATVPVTVV